MDKEGQSVGTGGASTPMPSAPSGVISSGNIIAPGSEAGPSSSHPFFTNHPTQTYASGTGDIVIGGNEDSEKTKISKKIIIIAVSCICVLTVIVGAILFINALPTSSQTEGLKTAFNNYANYLLYGTDSSEEFTSQEFNANYVYYAMSQSYGESESVRQPYFEQLVDIFDVFMEQTEIYSLSEEQLEQIDSYAAKLYAYSTYATIDEITEDALLAYYILNGETMTQNVIDAQYGSLKESTDETASILGDYLIRESTFWLEEFQVYQSFGCIVEQSLDYDCAKEVSLTQELATDEDILSIQNGIKITAAELQTNVFSRCWEIYELL